MSAARMWDSGAPHEITRNIMKQGSGLAEDDRLAIILDPFNTRRQGYRFEVNANGVRNDMLYQNNQLQPEWTVIWEAAGALGDDGWTAEMAIPFKTLPFDPPSTRGVSTYRRAYSSSRRGNAVGVTQSHVEPEHRRRGDRADGSRSGHGARHRAGASR